MIAAMANDLFARKVRTFGPRLMADLGLKDFQAAGVFGNVGHECGGFLLLQEIKPTVAGSRGGYGWMQWTGPRRRKYEAWCAARKLDPASDQANYGYLIAETNTDEIASLLALRGTRNVMEATEVFCRKNLRPGVEHMNSRKTYARRALDELAVNYTPMPDPPAIPIPPPPDIPAPKPVSPQPAPQAGFFMSALTAFLARFRKA